MKALAWTKLGEAKVKGTVFEKFASDYKGIAVDYKELEEQFSMKVVEKKGKEN
jgi:hypothetical protein